MALLKIARMGHPILRRPAEPVPAAELETPEFQAFIDDMVETMRDGDGVGLAAPQVHQARRIILIEVKGTNPRYPDAEGIPLTAIVNPEIVTHSPEVVDDWEGCLSIPDLRGLVPRWQSLRLKGLDREGRPLDLVASDFFARVIQHELDHVDGILFLDRMRDMRSLSFLREFQRYGIAEAP